MSSWGNSKSLADRLRDNAEKDADGNTVTSFSLNTTAPSCRQIHASSFTMNAAPPGDDAEPSSSTENGGAEVSAAEAEATKKSDKDDGAVGKSSSETATSASEEKPASS